MPGGFLADDIETMQDTDEFGHVCTIGENSFGVQFVLEDEPTDIFDETIEGANAYIIVETKYVADIASGVLVTIGIATEDDAGSGLAGGDMDLIVDLEDTEVDTSSGLRQYYVIKTSPWGDDDLMQQIFLSEDKQ